MVILDIKNIKFSKLFPGKIYWEDEKLVYPFRFKVIKENQNRITRANITDTCEDNYPLSSYFGVFYKLLRTKINTLLDKKDVPVYNLFDDPMNPWSLISEDGHWFSASYCQDNNITNKNKDKLNIIDTKDLHYFFDLIKENINIMIGSGEYRIKFDPSKIWADKSIEIMAEDKSCLFLYENNSFKKLRISCFRDNWLLPLKMNANIIINNLEINKCQLYDSELLYNYRKSHMSIINSEVRNSKIEKESLILDNIIFGENSKFSCYKQLLLRINEKKNKFKNCEFHCCHGYNEIYNSRHNHINIDKVSSQEGLSIYCEENSTIHIKECWCINEYQFIIGINKNTNLIIDNLYVPDKSVLINVCESEAIFGINVPVDKVGFVKIGKRNDDLINNIKINNREFVNIIDMRNKFTLDIINN